MTREASYQRLFKERESFSRKRLEKLRNEFQDIQEFENFPQLTIFGSGPYARLEASEHSNIDLFFLSSATSDELEEPTTSRIRLFSKVIDIVEEMNFPKFSDDGKYLEVLPMDDMIKKLGSRKDDYKNHFTTRMLLLLESKCLCREDLYKKAILEIVDSYFPVYSQHKENLKPILLINDILRYWKTLCLNIENKRHKQEDPTLIIKHKVRNFKLKFSRMTTCFASIAALSSQSDSITHEKVIELVNLTPRQRLQKIPDCIPEAQEKVEELLELYSWFLKMSSLPPDKLNENFDDAGKKRKAFDKANQYGDKMFELLQLAGQKYDIFRYLVI